MVVEIIEIAVTVAAVLLYTLSVQHTIPQCACWPSSLGSPPSNDAPVGVYPEVVTQDNGDRVLVVHDFAFGKYLGFLQVSFDDQGKVTSYGGNPILLDGSVIPGKMEMLKPHI
jgi:hypothetical protein